MMKGTPPLIFRGLDRCDACGGPLAPAERLSGLCRKCEQPPTRPVSKAKRKRDR